jgi:CheY-like chemotaxis protein
VDDLLEVSRITGGKIELRQEPIELAAVIQHAVENSHSLISAGKHRLRVSLPSAPLRLVVDPVRLTQVFSNLLNNAAKYTETGGLIEILARNEKGEAVVSIRDSGVGIPAEMLPQIFDLFTQVDSNLGRARDGLGIGLAIVHTLVEMHGGRVEAYSSGLNRGSEFIVYLPLADEGKDVEKQAQSVEPATKVKRRILITDDNRDVADVHAMLLMELGADVRVVYDGQSALNALAEFKPEILLLDIGMPNMDGYETARRIRQRPDSQSIQLVALTGWGQKEDCQRSLDAGFTQHLVKPVSLDQLKSLLATSVDD